jgi:ABC-type phosphate transport system permease subunit
MSSASIDPPAAPAPQRLDARTLARTKREALRRRTRRIRRSVLGIAAVAFVTAFLVIYVQLASGHDPALSKRGTATSKTATTATDRRKQASAAKSSSSGTESSSASAAVTTSQS